jgi:hypothetical protein
MPNHELQHSSQADPDGCDDNRAKLSQRAQQLRTGAGDSLDAVRVQWVRFSAKLKGLKERLLPARRVLVSRT